MVALVLWNLAAWIVVAGLRFGADLDLALWFGPPSWPMIAAVAVALTVIAMRREVKDGRRPCSSRDRTALWILLGLGPLLIWALGDRDPTGGADVVVFVVLLLVGLERVYAHRAAIFRRGTWFAAGGRNGRVLAVGTAVVVVALAVTGALAGESETSVVAWALALASYPLYALVQLGAALALPRHVWSGDGHGSRSIVASVALLFALIHAPNPLVMGMTGAGMIAWAVAHARGVGFAWIALSMGLCGATAAQALPFAWTENMRVNSTYVLARQVERHIEVYDTRVDLWASDATLETTGGTLRGWLAALGADAFGAPVPARVLDDWTTRVANARRDRVLRMFLDSEEFRRRHGIERFLHGRDQSLLYPSFVPWDRAQAAYDTLRAHDPARVPDTSFAEFLREAYRAFLQRVPADEEVAGWSPVPSVRGRTEVVRVVLALAGTEDPALWRRPTKWPDWAQP